MAEAPRPKLRFDGTLDPDGPLPPRYQVRGELGRGGMGIVYHALDRETDTEVAIKVITDSSVASRSVSERLRREARELSHLSHPNLVGYLGQGSRNGRQYIVLEYVPGGDLRRLLRDRPPLRTVLRLFHTAALGLEYLHGQGLVHRDLKPENILIAPKATAKLTDLGLVKALESNTRLTTDGAIVGTYSYLAPEQILSGELTSASDLYALGCCLYEACTGQPLFVGNTDFEMLEQHLRSQPVPPRQHQSDLPQELEDLILALVGKKPEQRPAAAEVAERLKALLGDDAEEDLVLDAPVAEPETHQHGWIPDWRRRLARKLVGSEPGPEADWRSWSWPGGPTGFPSQLLRGNLQELARGMADLMGEVELPLPTPGDGLRTRLDRAMAAESDPNRREELDNLTHELRTWSQQRDIILEEAARSARELVELRQALAARGASLAGELEEALRRVAELPPDEPASAALAAAWMARLDRAWAGMMNQVQP